MRKNELNSLVRKLVKEELIRYNLKENAGSTSQLFIVFSHYNYEEDSYNLWDVDISKDALLDRFYEQHVYDFFAGFPDDIYYLELGSVKISNDDYLKLKNNVGKQTDDIANLLADLHKNNFTTIKSFSGQDYADIVSRYCLDEIGDPDDEDDYMQAELDLANSEQAYLDAVRSWIDHINL